MEFNIIDKTQLALQCYDRKILTGSQVSKIIGINLNNGDFDGEWEEIVSDTLKYGILMQLLDRTLITKKVLLKQLFDLENKEE